MRCAVERLQDAISRTDRMRWALEQIMGEGVSLKDATYILDEARRILLTVTEEDVEACAAAAKRYCDPHTSSGLPVLTSWERAAMVRGALEEYVRRKGGEK